MGILETKAIDLSFDDDQYAKWLIYGQPGTRKTTFAASMPNPAWLDYERSTDTLRSLIKSNKLTGNFQAFKPKTMAETWDISKAIVASKQWSTIVIDTCTRQQKKQMAEYIANHPSVKEGKRDKFTTYQADFGYSYRILDDFYMWLVEQPINVVMLSHDTEEYKVTETASGQVSKTLIKIKPTLTPKLLESATELFSLIGYMSLTTTGFGSNATTVHQMQVNPTGLIVAKNRLDITTPTVIDPTYERLMKK